MAMPARRGKVSQTAAIDPAGGIIAFPGWTVLALGGASGKSGEQGDDKEKGLHAQR